MNQHYKQHAPLEMRALDLIRRHHLLEQPGRLVVAVSGGPDSVCLLHILLGLKDQLPIELHIAHLNHRLRGVDSQNDAQYVSELARKLGIPSIIEERDVKAYRTKQHLTLEEAAREVRYGFLHEVVKSLGAVAVAVGHTRDDNVETILMHLIRGTGTRGLRGLQPASRWPSSGKASGSMAVLRPLLNITREETAGYCREHNLVPRIDKTNHSLSLIRNRVRLKLLPELRCYNPRIDDALLRMARIAGDEYDFLNKEGNRLWRNIAEERDNAIVLNKRKLLRQTPALQRYLLRMTMEKTIGNLKDIETRHVEEMLDTLEKKSGTTIILPGSLVFAVEYDRYLLAQDPAALCPFPVLEKEFRLNVPGETKISGWHITATLSPHTGDLTTAGIENYHSQETKQQVISLSACLDYDKIRGKLTIRSYQPGDRFQPLGLGQTKKVGQFMVDARIPRWWRDRVPIISSSEHIIWVAGWRIDERVRIIDTSTNILCLELKQTP
jgi:tRNA(Ile)-lysidine synthase